MPKADKAVFFRMKAIDSTIERCLAEGDAAGYVRANTAFHATLYACADAPADDITFRTWNSSGYAW